VHHHHYQGRVLVVEIPQPARPLPGTHLHTEGPRRPPSSTAAASGGDGLRFVSCLALSLDAIPCSQRHAYSGTWHRIGNEHAPSSRRLILADGCVVVVAGLLALAEFLQQRPSDPKRPGAKYDAPGYVMAGRSPRASPPLALRCPLHRRPITCLAPLSRRIPAAAHELRDDVMAGAGGLAWFGSWAVCHLNAACTATRYCMIAFEPLCRPSEARRQTGRMRHPDVVDRAISRDTPVIARAFPPSPDISATSPSSPSSPPRPPPPAAVHPRPRRASRSGGS